MTTGTPTTSRPAWVLVLIVAFFIVFGFLTNRAGQIAHGSNQTAFPIIAFEVAGSGESAERILSETVEAVATSDADVSAVREKVEDAVRSSLWWDFGFIVGYSLLIFVLAPALGRQFASGNWRRVGSFVAWSGLLAGALDVVENVALFQVVNDTSRDAWARVAAVVSWGKWALVAGALLYGFVGLVGLSARLLNRSPSDQG